MNSRDSNKIKKPLLGHGSTVYFFVTLVLFLVALIWSKDAYITDTGSANVPLVIYTIFVFVISLLFVIVPFRRPLVFVHFHQKLFTELGFVLIAIASVLIINGYSTRYSFLEALSSHSFLYYLGNVVLAYTITQLLYLIFHSIVAVCDIITIGSLVFSGLNFYVVQFRGLPFAPWDIGAAFTAAEVASGYIIVATPGIIIGLGIMVMMHQLISCIPYRYEKRVARLEVYRLIVVVALLVLCYFGITRSIKVRFYDQAGYYDEVGFGCAFMSYLPYVSYRAPEGYDEARVKAELDKIDTIKADEERITAKNIIVVMNESLADFDVISNKLSSTNNGTDYLYGMHHLDNSVRGLLYVPTFGGNTCNSEFEFLTESSYYNMMGIPFLTFAKKGMNIESIADSTKGFVSQAFHPYNPKGWNRNSVYVSLGFSRLWSNEDMSDEEIHSNTVRSLVSDSNNYKVLNRIMASTDGDNKLLFNITLQNHGGYVQQYDDFKTDVDFSGIDDYEDAKTYLGLVKVSDKAFLELIDSYRNSDEPTIIVMFGDHQPALDTKFYDYLYGNEIKDRSIEEQQKQYITPYVIWANYDIDYNDSNLIKAGNEENYNGQSMSVNYLYSIIKRLANLPLDNYESYLYNMYQKYPVVHAYGVIDREGNYHEPDSGIFDEQELSKYKEYQYFRLNH